MKIIWNISNIFSLFRLLLALPLFIFILQGNSPAVVVVLFLGSISDILDGYLARKLNQISEFGKVIDPFADKVFVTALVVAMLFRGMLPLWFFLTILSRDILILTGGLFMAKKQRKVPASNFYGKMAVSAVGITLLLQILDVLSPEMFFIAMMVTVAALIISFIVYLKNFFISFK